MSGLVDGRHPEARYFEVGWPIPILATLRHYHFARYPVTLRQSDIGTWSTVGICSNPGGNRLRWSISRSSVIPTSRNLGFLNLLLNWGPSSARTISLLYINFQLVANSKIPMYSARKR